jgi:hypothetical protein
MKVRTAIIAGVLALGTALGLGFASAAQASTPGSMYVHGSAPASMYVHG